MTAILRPTPRSPLLAALRHRDFAVYIAARFFATLSWQMMNVAVGWQLYHLTHSALDLGLLGLCQFLPFALLVLPAGHVADRLDRRLVLIGAYAIAGCCPLLLLWFTLAQVHSVWPVFAALALFGAGRAFWMPTGQAMMPNLVPVANFPGAVAAGATFSQAAIIGGPAIGGLVLLFGPAVVYVAMLVLVCVVVGLIVSIKPIRVRPGSESFGAGDLLSGLRFVWQRRPVLGAISLDLFAVLFGGATALLPIYASDVLHVNPAAFGALRAAPGVGAALTAALFAMMPVERHAGRWMFSGVVLFGVATIVFGLSTHFWLSLCALLFLGCGDMVSVFVRQVLVQLETPDLIRGRVSAVSSMFIGASNELGEFESGVTARWLGLVPAVVVGGIATLAVVAVYLRLFPELRRLDRLRRL